MGAVSSSPRVRLIIGVAVVVVIALVVGAALLSSTTAGASSEQPIAFSHQVHTEAEIPCLFCHDGAMRGPVAGVPSVEQCMGCHQYIATESEEIQKLAGYWERGEPIPWRRITKLPRYAYYPHYIHIHAGVNCETCHGDVGNMDVVTLANKINMGWCLQCHQQEPDPVPLMDCVICHD